MNHKITYAQAIAEATIQAMDMDESVVVVGQGTRDKNAIFGSLEGVFDRFGPERVIEMPISENAIAGICIGLALRGFRPVLVLQRADFVFLCLDQIINHASKYHFMFGGQTRIPLTVRLIVGKDWGQGPQHSQSLHSMFAHFPGLRVAAPSYPRAAKGILLNSIFCDDPAIIFEGRPSYALSEEIPEEPYVVPFGCAEKLTSGKDITIAAVSFMAPEAVKAANQLKDDGVYAEVIDIISVNPLDIKTICASVKKTGRLLIVDTSWGYCGISAEISAQVSEQLFEKLIAPIKRLTVSFTPTPTAHELEKQFYPDVGQVIKCCKQMMQKKKGLC